MRIVFSTAWRTPSVEPKQSSNPYHWLHRKADSTNRQKSDNPDSAVVPTPSTSTVKRHWRCVRRAHRNCCNGTLLQGEAATWPIWRKPQCFSGCHIFEWFQHRKGSYRYWAQPAIRFACCGFVRTRFSRRIRFSSLQSRNHGLDQFFRCETWVNKYIY